MSTTMRMMSKTGAITHSNLSGSVWVCWVCSSILTRKDGFEGGEGPLGRRLSRSGLYFSASCSFLELKQGARTGPDSGDGTSSGSTPFMGLQEDSCGVMMKTKRRRRRRKCERTWNEAAIDEMSCLLEDAEAREEEKKGNNACEDLSYGKRSKEPGDAYNGVEVNEHVMH
ncbi:hypothetical protein BHM03_00035761 [Ensete ventricosum]|nr:hypothetical protein BHM03_00035761 [Ensete ventricosum]